MTNMENGFFPELFQSYDKANKADQGLFKPGDKVKIIDPNSIYFGQVGEVIKVGESGGLTIRHIDGQEVYRPLGYQKIE